MKHFRARVRSDVGKVKGRMTGKDKKMNRMDDKTARYIAGLFAAAAKVSREGGNFEDAFASALEKKVETRNEENVNGSMKREVEVTKLSIVEKAVNAAVDAGLFNFPKAKEYEKPGRWHT